MKRTIIPIILAVSVLQAGTVCTEIRMDSFQQPTLEGSDRGSAIMLPGAYPGCRPGMPSLPMIPYQIPLPDGSCAESVRFEAEWVSMASDVLIRPLPSPIPLILENDAADASPDQSVYSSSEFWPENIVRLTGTCFEEGVPTAQLLVYPFRWNPATGELQKIVSIRISVETIDTDRSCIATRDSGSFEKMLIVTDQTMLSSFQALAERRCDQGIMTEVVTMDSVMVWASGRDEAETLRNFVKDYYVQNGLDYLLLGGDTDAVPFRYAYAMTCQAGMHPREDSLPCDLYFADLDGDWDANGNDVFGEVDDDVDLYSDISVGRAPVDTPGEAQTFVDAIIDYEDCLYDDYYRSVLFLAMILWSSPYTNSGESKDYIDEEFLPDFLDITKLYEAMGNENLSTTMLALNEGQNLINHDGHAWYSSIGVGDDYMGISDVDAINSGGRYAASMYSIGCWSAAFDFDAIAEHFLINPNGGSVAYVGNSSYGWGSPGNPCYGYSDALDHLYHDYLYSDWSLTSGELLGLTKEYFIPYSQWENVYRWHQYDVNLLGDPSLRPYRDTPSQINIETPDIVTPNTVYFPVHVTGTATGGLRVCVHDQGSNWQVAELNAAGGHVFEFTSQVSGQVSVTVTGAGARRTSVTVPNSTGPDPVISQLTVNDDRGYGVLSPGCSADLEISVLNQGTSGLTDLRLIIEDVSGQATLTADSMWFGNVPAAVQSAGSPAISLLVDQSNRNGDVVKLTGSMISSEDDWDVTIPFLICAPGLYFTTYTVDDSQQGDDDGIPEPGETFDLSLSIANNGLLTASEVEVRMLPDPSGYVSWLSDSAYVDSIQNDCTGQFLFQCHLDGGTPSPWFPWLGMEIASVTSEYESTDSLRLTVGETGISNDVESGTAGWAHSGTGDLWNITDGNSHSPDHSWHCGDTQGYGPNMDCSLLSPELILAPCAELSFWATFDVAIYGNDGLYVIVNDLDDASSDTLDYIGSGGALGPVIRGAGTGWAQWRYSLDSWEAGDNVQLEFKFVSDSDSDTGMGFYIDDMTVEGAYVGSTGTGTQSPVLPMMGLPSPNPCHGSFSLPLNISASGSWTISVYDVAGRRVLDSSGESPVQQWVEFDASSLSPGIYFLRLSGAAEGTRRLVLVR